jgi:large subunit ribosomal protein L10
MALSKAQKESAVDELVTLVQDCEIVVLSKYSGLTVTDLQQLRRLATSTGSVVKVAKNRLLKIALKKCDIGYDEEKLALKDQLMFVFNPDDVVTPAKMLREFSVKHPSVELRGAILRDGQTLTIEEVRILSQLPTIGQLHDQLVGLISSPLRGLAIALSENLRSLLRVMDAHSQKMAR